MCLLNGAAPFCAYQADSSVPRPCAGADDPKTFRGFLHSVEAKGRFAFVEQHLSTEDLEDFMKHTLGLQRYGSEISLAIPGGTNALNALAAYANLKPLSSIEKPTWPERLKKHRSYLGESSPQPESSGV